MNAITNLFDALTPAGGTRVVIAVALAVAIGAAAVALLTWAAVRAIRGAARGNAGGRRVLIVVAVTVAFAVAGIGGVQSFTAVSEKFGSPLVPLVADGMVIACTALRLAALTRGWRIPGALLTTYVFIGGTVALNIDAANGHVDKAIAHALAPLAYAVLVEMLAHMLRMHLKLSQPARAKLSALTWFTSPVITTRVWLHLSRTGSNDPVEARALVQQVVRMSSRLSTVCPSPKWLPFGAAHAARSAALQTIRDGLLTAGALAALLPTDRRLAAGELLALVDGAALGIPAEGPQTAGRAEIPAWAVLWLLSAQRDQITPHHSAPAEAESQSSKAAVQVPPWMLGYLLGALHQLKSAQLSEQSTPAPAPLQDRAGAGAPVQARHASASARASVISAPVAESSRSGAGVEQDGGGGVASSLAERDEADLRELRKVSRELHGGEPLGQREITRVLGCGFSKARRLAELAGWVEGGGGDNPARHGANDTEDNDETDANSNHHDDTDSSSELEMSSNA